MPIWTSKVQYAGLDYFNRIGSSRFKITRSFLLNFVWLRQRHSFRKNVPIFDYSRWYFTLDITNLQNVNALLCFCCSYFEEVPYSKRETMIGQWSTWTLSPPIIFALLKGSWLKAESFWGVHRTARPLFLTPTIPLALKFYLKNKTQV